MSIEREQNKFRQTFASDVEIEKLQKITGEQQVRYAIRAAILKTIKGA